MKKLLTILLYSIPFLALLVDGTQMFPFITGKGFLFRLAVEVAFVLWIATKGKVYKNGYFYALLALLGSLALSNVLGLNPENSFLGNLERMDGWFNILHLFAYFVMLSSTIKNWGLYWTTYLIPIFILGVGSFLPHSDRLSLTLGNPIYLAGLMTFGFFLSLYLLSKTKRWLLRLFYALVAILSVISIYITETRGAIVALVGGLLVISLLTLKRKGVYLLIGLLVLTTGFLAIKDTNFVKGQNTLNRLSNISLKDNTTLSRLILWDISIEGIKDRPLLGYGQENFSYVFDKHYDKRLFGQEFWFDKSHNVFFDWLISGGIIAFVLYVSLIVMSFRHIHKRHNVLLMALLVSYLVQSLFVFDQLISYIGLFSLFAFLAPKDKELPHKNMLVTPLFVLLLISAFYNAKGYLQSRYLVSILQEPVVTEQTIIEYDNVLTLNSIGNRETYLNLYNQSLLMVVDKHPLSEQFLAYTIGKFQEKENKNFMDNYLYLNLLSLIGLEDKDAINQLRELSPAKFDLLTTRNVVE